MSDPETFIRRHTRPQPVLSVPEISLYQADELTSLWQMTEADLARHQLPPPFWAFPWAGGQALARYILDHPDCIRGKHVVDIACGSGLVAIAAAKAGAAGVTANDIDPYCGVAVSINAALNGVEIAFDGRDLLSVSPPQADVFLAGDIAYEKAMSIAMMTFFSRAVSLGSVVYLGDPHRAYFPQGLRRCADYDIVTTADLENDDVKTTTVWALEHA